MTRVLLVRHAQSEWNAAGRWQGWADPPLSALGRAQAERAGERLRQLAPPIARAVSSDLLRAHTTARIMAGIAGTPELAAGLADHRPLVDRNRGLRELDVGAWSGLTGEEVASRWPDHLAQWRAGSLDAAPGGEQRERFDARVRAALAQVLADHAGQHVLVVAHGGVVRSVGQWLGAPLGPNRHVAGFWIDHDGERAEISGAVDLLDDGTSRNIRLPDSSGGAR